VNKVFLEGKPQQQMTNNQYHSFMKYLYVILINEFEYPAGKLRGLLLLVTAATIKHFVCIHHGYKGQHLYVTKMVTACLNSGIG
jgi:hypothetical protein